MAKRKTKKSTATNKPVTHVMIILDRSGSMEACRDETISGFNEQVQKITGKAKSDGVADSTFVTLALFNSEVEYVRFADPVSTLGKLTSEYYVPDGTTAMIDAIGMTLSRFDREVKDTEDTNYLVIVISDGEENDSQEFTYEHAAEMIQKRRKTGRWTFTYMGANQDLSDLSRRMSIPKSNMAAYTSSRRGTQVSFNRLSESVVGFMDKRSKGTATSDKFFRESEEIRSVEDDDDESGSGPLLH